MQDILGWTATSRTGYNRSVSLAPSLRLVTRPILEGFYYWHWDLSTKWAGNDPEEFTFTVTRKHLRQSIAVTIPRSLAMHIREVRTTFVAEVFKRRVLWEMQELEFDPVVVGLMGLYLDQAEPHNPDPAPNWGQSDSENEDRYDEDALL